MPGPSPAEEPAGTRTRGRSRPAALIPFLAAAILFSLFALRFWFVTDDAFISFRYAAHWADGEGLRYNMGVDPPVEGFSNFLWTALMAAVGLAGGDMPAAAPWISFILGLVLLALVYRFLARVVPPGGETAPVYGGAAAAGLFFLALFPPFFVWATGGLETMLFALLLFIAFERLLGKDGAPHGLAAGTAAALLSLTRPEGLIWAMALAGIYAAEGVLRRRKPAGRALASYLAVVLGVAACFLAARFLYFEKLLPNTFYAKVGLSAPVLKRGLFYLLDFSLTFGTPVVLAAFLPFLPGKGFGPIVRRSLVVLGGFAAFTILSGGDFMAMGRFLAPAAPFLAVLFAALITKLRRDTTMPPAAVATCAAACLLLQLLPAADMDLLPAGLHRALDFRWRNRGPIRSEYGQWLYMRSNRRKWEATGRKLREYAREGDSIVCPNIGAIGYYSGLFVYDACGLVDPEVAKRPLPAGSALESPGHDKIVPPTFFLPEKPTFLRSYVVENSEVSLLVSLLEGKNLPRGYRVTTLPLDGIEAAPPGSSLVLVERIPEKEKKKGRKTEEREKADSRR